MFKDTFTSRWNRIRSDSKRQWNKLTDEDLDQIKDNMEDLVNLVQEKYEYTKDQAQQEVEHFMDTHDGKAVQIARRLPGDMDRGVKQHPWAAIATAIGLGLLLGFLFKPSQASAAESDR
jgi:ElaB/YqjD/DUF883 family membrane-anchored ribosome-binding protein